MFITSFVLAITLTHSQSVQADPLDRLVSFEHEAARAERLIPLLAKECHILLSVDTSTRDDVLLISVKDVAIRDLLARIAHQDDATWCKSEDGGLVLKRSDELRSRCKERDRATLIKAYREQIAKTRSSLGKDRALSVEEASKVLDQLKETKWIIQQEPGLVNLEQRMLRGRIESQKPIHRLATRVLSQFDPEILASLPIDRGVFYSSQPNRFQKRFPFDINRSIEIFLTEGSNFFKASPSLAESNIGNNRYKKAPWKLVAKATRSTQNYVRLSLYIVWNGGKVDSSLSGIRPFEPDYFDRKSVSDDNDDLQQYLGDRPRRFLAELLRLNAARSSGCFPEMRKDVRSWYCDPINNEPLALTSGGVLAAIAHKHHKNVVAVLSDQIDELLTWLEHTPKPSLCEVEKRLESGCDLKVESTDSWIEAHPRMPSMNWSLRTDRSLFAKFIRLCDDDFVTLDTKVKALSCFSSNFSGLASILDAMSAQGSSLSLDLPRNRDFLRFWGTISHDQKALLRSGSRIRVADLTPNQYANLLEMIAAPQFVIDLGPLNPNGNSIPDEFMTGFACEAIPNGLPKTAYLQMGVDLCYEVSAYHDGQLIDTVHRQPAHIGSERYHFEHPTYDDGDSVFPNQYRVLQASSLSLKLVLQAGCDGFFPTYECKPVLPDLLLRYDELPKEIRDEAEREYRRLSSYDHIKL